jgi:hypothetical protein
VVQLYKGRVVSFIAVPNCRHRKHDAAGKIQAYGCESHRSSGTGWGAAPHSAWGDGAHAPFKSVENTKAAKSEKSSMGRTADLLCVMKAAPELCGCMEKLQDAIAAGEESNARGWS